ncbi:MAG: hypothetical protein RL328_236 [Acidobacteriota bacterium]
MRRLIFWTHLIAGTLAGIVILVMSVTGVLLAYEKQTIASADRRMAGLRTAGPAMSTERLLAGLKDQGIQAAPSSITLRSDPSMPASVTVGRETLLVDPVRGRVLAPQDAYTRAFFRRITEWHRWLGDRAKGRAATGAANLIFLFLVVSGLYLWFPRRWAWPNLRAVLWFRTGLSGRARDFNWHNAAGFWACVPLFFIVLSGVVMSYSWANDLVYALNGEAPPAGRRPAPRPERPSAIALEGLDVLVARAKQQAPDWKTITFSVPAPGSAPVAFAVDAGNGGQPQYRTTLTLSRGGELLKTATFADQSAGQRARSWMRFVHTGEYYGIAGQSLAGLASAAGAVLVWTGLALAYRRCRRWLSRDPLSSLHHSSGKFAA